MKVAIQGELGSFSHEAAHRLLPSCSVVPCALSAEVFERVVSGAVQAAVVPIENSLAGPVTEHYDLLLANDVTIQREIQLRIQHCLVAPHGSSLRTLARVLSHPVALQQCREFFRRNRQISAVPFYDTAGSVKHIIRERDTSSGAIASARAADQYGGKILLRGLEDSKQNYTRFFLVRSPGRIPRGANKTSIAFALKNAPGALFRALSVFALRDIDLTKIESRPMPGRPWEYVFYVDFNRGRDESTQNALRHLAEIAEFVKVLGVYAKA